MPFIFVTKITASWKEILTPKTNNNKNTINQFSITNFHKSHIGHDAYINVDLLEAMGSLGLETGLPINSQMNESNIVSDNQLSSKETASQWI